MVNVFSLVVDEHFCRIGNVQDRAYILTAISQGIFASSKITALFFCGGHFEFLKRGELVRELRVTTKCLILRRKGFRTLPVSKRIN